MNQEPFTILQSNAQWCELNVPPGHQGFVLNSSGRSCLETGVHHLNHGSSHTVFVIPVGASHSLDLICLGGAMMRGADGRWQPLKFVGRLSYSVAKPHLLVDLLERDEILQPKEFERELSRIVVEQLASFVEGEAWSADKLAESLEFASGEVLRNLVEAVAPLGLALHAFELVPGSFDNNTLQTPA